MARELIEWFLANNSKSVKSKPSMMNFSFKIEGFIVLSSAYGIRTRDLLLEREVS